MKKAKHAEQILENFCIGYKNRDLHYLLSLFTQDVNMWGTGIDEYRIGQAQVAAQLQRDWSQSDKSEIQIISFVPTPDDALWTAAICRALVTIDGKLHQFEDLRGTVVIAHEDHHWKISHMHCSFPDYRNPAQSSFPVQS